MLSLKKIITISRPRFWIYGLGPYLLALAHILRVDNDFALLPLIVLGIFFTLPANLLVYGINDIFDQETDALNPKKDSYENRLHKDEVLPLSLFIGALVLPFVLVVIGSRELHSIIIFLSTLFLLVFYSAPPFRFKNIPFVDSLTNGLMSIAPFVFILVFLQETVPIISIIAGGIWAMALHIFSAIPDIASDAQAGLSTTATTLGTRGALIFVNMLLVTSILLSALLITPVLVFIGIPYLILFMTPLWRPDMLFSLYKKIPLVTFVSGMLLFFMILFL